MKTSDDDGDSGPPSRTIVCGDKGTKADAPLLKACAGDGWSDLAACARTDKGTPELTAPFATAPIVNGKEGRAQVWCPGDVVPALAQDAIRAEAIRLLPRVAIGSAPATTSLVNIEAVLWAATRRVRTLPTAHVLGSDVRLRVAFDHAGWRFGDGRHDSASEPGKPYDRRHDPCRTTQCAHYYGHTYRRPGRYTITMTVTWTAQFSLDGAASWTDLDQPVTGATTTRVVTVRQTRAVLVPNPGEH